MRHLKTHHEVKNYTFPYLNYKAVKITYGPGLVGITVLAIQNIQTKNFLAIVTRLNIT